MDHACDNRAMRVEGHTAPFMRLLRARIRGQAGFTLVELMAVLVISVIGFLAMIHLQTAMLRATTTAWDTTSATLLAEHVLEAIRTEALEWTNNSDQPPWQTKFHYLNALSPGASTSGWRRAFPTTGAIQMVNQAGRLFGTGVQYDAGVVAAGGGADGPLPDNRNQRFCVNYRLTWIIQDELLRAEVRVMWPRSDSQAARWESCPAGMENEVNDVSQVTLATTVMRNVFVSP